MRDKLKLLIADDEIKFLESMAKRLELRGFEVSRARDGRQALQYADQEKFDLALIDLKMPEMDGKQVLQHLKRYHDSVEVIIMTGHGSQESAVECLEMGAFSYIPKPYELDRIIEIFRQAYATHLKEKHKFDPKIVEQISVLEREPDSLSALHGMRILVK